MFRLIQDHMQCIKNNKVDIENKCYWFHTLSGQSGLNIVVCGSSGVK